LPIDGVVIPRAILVCLPGNAVVTSYGREGGGQLLIMSQDLYQWIDYLVDCRARREAGQLEPL
jgi:hypothetical protein